MKPLAGNIHFKSSLFDFQLIRSLHHSRFGGPDFGECFAICFQVNEGDWDGWYSAWMVAADRSRRSAENFLAGGRLMSAKRMFLRAFECYRSAAYAFLSDFQDKRLIPTVTRMQYCFRKAGELMDGHMHLLNIPYENSTLSGYFFQSDTSGRKRPTVIINRGCNTFCEESYFLGGVSAMERGWNVLLYDGPGQGCSLVRKGFHFRHDWEKVLTPVIDHALTLNGVDPSKIAVFGRSFNSLLSARAIASEHRVAAFMADPGKLNQYRDVVHEFPQDAITAFENGDDRVLATWLESRMREPDFSFSLKCRMLAHGKTTPIEYIRELKKYDLTSLIPNIQCPTAIAWADHDDRGTEQAKEMYELLRCPKVYFPFSADQGAAEHCQTGAPELCYQTFYDWLESVLK